ncbi:MAG: hypothetical protein FWG65_13110 [Turicibacter sp.]|nr:hypothetical protein [Turicibacter sp.]
MKKFEKVKLNFEVDRENCLFIPLGLAHEDFEDLVSWDAPIRGLIVSEILHRMYPDVFPPLERELVKAPAAYVNRVIMRMNRVEATSSKNAEIGRKGGQVTQQKIRKLKVSDDQQSLFD